MASVLETRRNELVSQSTSATTSAPVTIDGISITAPITCEEINEEKFTATGNCKISVGNVPFSAEFSLNKAGNAIQFKYTVSLNDTLAQFIPGGKTGTLGRKFEMRFPNVFDQNITLMRTNTIKIHGNKDWTSNYLTVSGNLSSDVKEDLKKINLYVNSATLSFSSPSLQWNNPTSTFAKDDSDIRIYAKLSNPAEKSYGNSEHISKIEIYNVRLNIAYTKQNGEFSYAFGVLCDINFYKKNSFWKWAKFTFHCELARAKSNSGTFLQLKGDFDTEVSEKDQAFGFKGWMIKAAALDLELTKDNNVQTSSGIKVIGSMTIAKDDLEITGNFFVTKGAFGVLGTIGNFTFEDIETLFRDQSSAQLAPFGNDVTFEEITLGYASSDDVPLTYGDDEPLTQGFTAFGKISVDTDWQEAPFDNISAKILVNSQRVRIEGYLEGFKLTGLNNFELKKTYLLANIKRKGATGGSTGFALGGIVQIEQVELEAEVIKIVGAEPNLIAIASVGTGKEGLSDLLGNKMGSMLNVNAFNAGSIGCIYAQKGASEDIVSKYCTDWPLAVEQGFQVYAEITNGAESGASGDGKTGKLAGINSLNQKASSTGFRMLAATSTPSFTMYFADSSFNLGPRCTIKKTYFRITKPFELTFVVGFDIKLAKSDPRPLELDLELDIGLKGAAGCVGFHHDWDNILGIHGLSLKGRNGEQGEVTLGVEIIYATFLATGLPSGFYFCLDSIWFGTITFTAALNISEDPSKELIFAQINRISPTDIANALKEAFSIDLTGIVSDDLFVLEDLKFYLCTGDFQIGGREWKKGWQFRGAMKILNSLEAYINFKMLDGEVQIQGIMKTLTLGPIKVTCNKDYLKHTDFRSSIENSGNPKAVNVKSNSTAISYNTSKNNGKAPPSAGSFSSKDQQRATLLQDILTDPGPFIDVKMSKGDFHVAMSARIQVSFLGESYVECDVVATKDLIEFRFEFSILSVLSLKCLLRSSSLNQLPNLTVFFSLEIKNELTNYIKRQCTKAINEGIRAVQKTKGELDKSISNLQSQYTAQSALNDSYSDKNIASKMNHYKQQDQQISSNLRKSQSNIQGAMDQIDAANNSLGEAINSGAWKSANSSMNNALATFNSLINEATNSRNNALDGISDALAYIVELHTRIADNDYVQNSMENLKVDLKALYKRKRALKKDWRRASKILALWIKTPHMPQESIDCQRAIATAAYNVYAEVEREFSNLVSVYYHLKTLLHSMKDSVALKSALRNDQITYEQLKSAPLLDVESVAQKVKDAHTKLKNLEQDFDNTLREVQQDLGQAKTALNRMATQINQEATEAHKIVAQARKGCVIAYDNFNYSMRCLKNSFVSIGLSIAKACVDLGCDIAVGCMEAAKWIINTALSVFVINDIKLSGQISTNKDTYLSLHLDLTVIGIHVVLDLTIDLGNLGAACTSITSKALAKAKK